MKLDRPFELLLVFALGVLSSRRLFKLTALANIEPMKVSFDSTLTIPPSTILGRDTEVVIPFKGNVTIPH